MHSEKSFDAFLAKQLQASHDYLEDDGFSSKVLAQLPGRKRISRPVETLIMWVPVVLVGLVVLSQFPWRDLVQPIYAWLLTMDMVLLIKAGAMVLAACILAPIAWAMRRLEII